MNRKSIANVDILALYLKEVEAIAKKQYADDVEVWSGKKDGQVYLFELAVLCIHEE